MPVIFMALMGLRDDEQSFVKYLPVMIDVMTREGHYNPRVQMLKQLRNALAKWKNDSAPGKLIVAGFTQATMNSEVLPNVGGVRRSLEGTANIVEVALASIVQAPEAAADLAEAIAAGGRLAVLDTPMLMKITRAPDGDVSDRFIGLLPALAKLLVEAKAYVEEGVDYRSHATGDSAKLIRKSLAAAKKAFHASEDASWESPFYQYANRLAHLYYLNALNRKQAYLLFLYFADAPDVVGHQDHHGAPLRIEPLEDREEELPRIGVEGRRGLVEDQQLRVVDDGTGDQYALFLPAREFADRGVRDSRDVQEAEDPIDSLAVGAGEDPRELLPR